MFHDASSNRSSESRDCSAVGKAKAGRSSNWIQPGTVITGNDASSVWLRRWMYTVHGSKPSPPTSNFLKHTQKFGFCFKFVFNCNQMSFKLTFSRFKRNSTWELFCDVHFTSLSSSALSRAFNRYIVNLKCRITINSSIRVRLSSTCDCYWSKC